MIPEIADKTDEIRTLCERYGVQSLSLFGSATHGAFRQADSDVDFLVEFIDPAVTGYADRYFGLKEDLEHLLQRPVDLVVASAIVNPFFRRSVEESRVPLYAA